MSWIRWIRRNLITRFVMRILARTLPRMGDTERIALEAGTVWWDAELFSGRPDWKKLLDFGIDGPSAEECAFLEGPTEELCRMLNDWDVVQARDLPEAAWSFIKKNLFFGMIIPKDYGGLGFSARAHADVITKLSSLCITAAVTVMVPNSLGPAELLLHYGTEEQKRHYLPRLARGEEIPCFALTGPEAGSDAASTESHGIVCRGNYEGKEVLGMRLTWNKRYITLGPIATVIGLAFQLLDPDHLIGDKDNLGITCALIPAHLPGITIGERHDPMGVPFQNGPNHGHDVFVPLEFIIGGRAQAGQGWRMLMECLGAGRGISLPSLAVGAAQLATRVVSAYGMVREQFDMPIGRFEGIEEPLARIGGMTYLMNAARRLTLGALDHGEKPAVVTAIMKAYLTESMRAVVNDAMDIQAGAGISQGPHNLLGQLYKALPIGITVEGANILTRSLIIYGQGAIRCHPFVQKEMRAVAEKNLVDLDRAFFGHVGFVFKNVFRAFLPAALKCSPVRGKTAKYFKRLAKLSASFALTSDVAMATLGGGLKRAEKLSGRLADALAWMYLASAGLKQYEDDGESKRDLPLTLWGTEHALYAVQTALVGVIENLPNRFAAWVLKKILFPFGARLQKPSDALGAEVARGLLENPKMRQHLTSAIFIPQDNAEGLGPLEDAFEKTREVLPLDAKIHQAVKSKKLTKASKLPLAEAALKAGILTPEEFQKWKVAKEKRDAVIQVDAFDPATFRQLRS